MKKMLFHRPFVSVVVFIFLSSVLSSAFVVGLRVPLCGIRGFVQNHNYGHSHDYDRDRVVSVPGRGGSSGMKPFPFTRLLAVWPTQWLFGGDKMDPKSSSIPTLSVRDSDVIGSGSYGTVHLGRLLMPLSQGGGDDDDDGDNEGSKETTSSTVVVAKRAWTEEELLDRRRQQEREALRRARRRKKKTGERHDNERGKGKDDPPSAVTDREVKELAQRCRHYFDVEAHCFEKFGDGGSNSDATSSVLPGYFGIHSDGEGRRWMVFKPVEGTKEPDRKMSKGQSVSIALTLADAIACQLDDDRQLHENEDDRDDTKIRNRLHRVHEALGLNNASLVPNDDIDNDNDPLARTLDVVMTSLLDAMVEIHSHQIVHRDIKPGNLLCRAQQQGRSLVLIDFGSAADMEPLVRGHFQKRVGYDDDGGAVAVSPIYAAPETFVKVGRSPFNFDVYSSALVFCQLLFHLLEEREMAGFHQQLRDIFREFRGRGPRRRNGPEDEEGRSFFLETWLSQQFSTGETVRPRGLEEALTYLGERPGLWRLLQDMIHPDPESRVSSDEAQRRWRAVMARRRKGLDSDYGLGVDFGVVSEEVDVDVDDNIVKDGSYFQDVLEIVEQCRLENDDDGKGQRSSYVVTFGRNEPLGLVLGEDDKQEKGRVYILEVLAGGQADRMGEGIFEVGDRLRAIGDLPFNDSGFERAVQMLSRQPTSTRTVKLKFERTKSSASPETKEDTVSKKKVLVVGKGACSRKGRRHFQEDTYVLTKISDGVTMAGVFDGHGGTAASEVLSRSLPEAFAEAVDRSRRRDRPDNDDNNAIEDALLDAWTEVCTSYRNGCVHLDDDESDDECAADYDPVEGVVKARVGSIELVAGSTASVVVVDSTDQSSSQVSVLNCGDSRSLLIEHEETMAERSPRSGVRFATVDHVPSNPKERERLETEYGSVRCSLSRWWVDVGEFRYAVSRSLEGAAAEAAGIVSEPDLHRWVVSHKTPQATLVLATDGLFAVMDNDEVWAEVDGLRRAGANAKDVSHQLCEKAIRKGSDDNVSVVVVYLHVDVESPRP